MKKNLPQNILSDFFLDRIKMLIPQELSTSVIEAFSKKRPTTFRVNILRISSDDIEKEIKKKEIICSNVPWYTDAYVVQNVTSKDTTALQRLQQMDVYKAGSIYVQSLSSMIPALVLDPQPGERVLDLCAAPGSKTTQMAMMMQNTGEIIANEKSHVRVYKLKANLKMQGVTNTTVTQMPGQILWQQYPEYFDRVLLDVPCSMEGRIQIDDPKTYEDWSMKKIKACVQTQRFLLKSAVSATKPGGYIVYSTCTLAPEENEGVIDWFLKKCPDMVDVMPITYQIPDTHPGIATWQGRVYHPSVSHTMRILPSRTMEGFFIALMRKRNHGT